MVSRKSKKKDEVKTENKKFESLKDKTAPIKSEKINKMAQMTEKKRMEMVKDTKKGVPIKYAIAIIAVIAALAGVLIFTMPGYIKPAGEPVKEGDLVHILYTGWLKNGSVFDSGNITFKAGGGEVIKGVDEAVVGMKIGEEKTVTVEPDKAYGYYDENKIFDIPLVNEMNRTESTTISVFNMTFGEEPVLNKSYRLEGMVWDTRVISIQNDTVKLLHEPQDGMTFERKDMMGNVYATATVNIEGEKLIITIHPIRGRTIATAYGTGKVVDMNETYMKLDFNHPLASETLTFEITLLNSV